MSLQNVHCLEQLETNASSINFQSKAKREEQQTQRFSNKDCKEQLWKPSYCIHSKHLCFERNRNTQKLNKDEDSYSKIITQKLKETTTKKVCKNWIEALKTEVEKQSKKASFSASSERESLSILAAG